MKRSSLRYSMRACAAAVCGAFALGAAAQVSIQDQVRVGLERAITTPMEIVMLRDEILAELWRRNPGLTQGLPPCFKTGITKHGCAVGNRPPRQYHLGSGSYAESGFAPLGRGVFIVAPQEETARLIRVPSGEIVLAAGSSVQLIDAAYPAIRVEVSAPPDKPLPLGNLVSADAARVFALLVRQPGVVSASAASIDAGGRVALRSPGEVQLAAAMPAPAAEILPPAPAVAPAEAVTQIAVAPQPIAVAFAGTIKIPAAPAVEVLARVEAPARQALVLTGSFQRQALPPAPTVAPAEAVTQVAVAPQPVTVAFAGTIKIPATPAVEVAAAPQPVTVAFAGTIKIPATPPVEVAVAPQPITVAGTIDVSAYKIASKPPVVAPAAVSGASSDIARLRAEVEAEIERDRARLANALQQACAGASARQGCAVNPARRFVSAG